MNGFPGADLLLNGIFVLSLLSMVGGALIAVLATRIIRSVCGLALCCIGLSGLYYFLHSPFLAMMQILIYVGAVCITIIFAVMLAEPDEAPVDKGGGAGRRLWLFTAFVVCVVLGLGFAWLATGAPWTVPAARVTDGSLKAIGISLLTTYSLAFEAISLVLLVAILGSLAIARGGRKHW